MGKAEDEHEALCARCAEAHRKDEEAVARGLALTEEKFRRYVIISLRDIEHYRAAVANEIADLMRVLLGTNRRLDKIEEKLNPNPGPKD